MRKLVIFFLVILVATVVASIYGIVHDQVTYSISPEYYTKFQFIHFNLATPVAAQHMTQPRSAVFMVGVLATWWAGVAVGLVLGLVALVYGNAEMMFQSVLQALTLMLLVAIIAGVAGGLYGHYAQVSKGVSWWLPPQLVDRGGFITAGTIHNYSYVGGAIGLVAGVVFLIVKNARIRKRVDYLG